jgi:GNAT superfamily N-acetyltransferase
MAYLNTRNFNIDYGIHVVKSYWRRRIGTALLVKLLELAKFMGASNISVVRVFRSVKGASADMRATKFYKANNPFTKLSIYRLKSGKLQ